MYLEKLSNEFSIFLKNDLELLVNLGIEDSTVFSNITLQGLDISRIISHPNGFENSFPLFSLSFKNSARIDSFNTVLITFETQLFPENYKKFPMKIWATSTDAINFDDAPTTGRYDFKTFDFHKAANSLSLTSNEFISFIRILECFKMKEKLLTIYNSHLNLLVNERVQYFKEDVFKNNPNISVSANIPERTTPTITFENLAENRKDTFVFRENFFSLNEFLYDV